MYEPFLIRSPRSRFEATSPGERLWFAIRDWWYNALGDQAGPQGLVGFAWLDGDGRPGQALTHAAISDACTRLARRADKVLTRSLEGGVEAEQFRDTVVSEVKQYCVSPMGMSFSDPILTVLGNLAFECARVSRQSISQTTRRDVHNEMRDADGHAQCYVCGLKLDGRYPLDHLWPQSLGGISGEANLLPVCEECNTRKKDRIGWDMFGVVVDNAFFGQTIEGGRIGDMALQRRAATRLAEQDKTTLKEALKRIGPVRIREKISPDYDGDWFYNNSVHDLSVLPQL